MTDLIIDALTLKYGCSKASSITHALAYCIAGANGCKLVHHMDDPNKFLNAVTPAMVLSAADEIDAFTKSLRARLNP